MKLFHFSEESNIPFFEPRKIYDQSEAKVWAIDEYHAPHYFFPRDCPRICLWTNEETSNRDSEKFFGMSASRRMVAIETRWYERLRTGHIYRYTFDPDSFREEDGNAGYYVSNQKVMPHSVERVEDLFNAILDEGIEVWVTPSLIPMRDRVLESTIAFSMIRMRNAQELG
ncbi:hypothetical protein D3P07_08610 [Paenibacillus sp. 1011MAR3C5]|uniref:DUF6886 family protein n=1 Tax=Paenibacillus sp. 1011MAR3C5 TaxID=1675787 RepID=UPI000E6C4C48|nr:DUF6886 family protein [Paenibacillus sp. 1011MAR3C5]RJE90258.1 hypothetical protein D3P07_08610 [Paenibacillus sp. 1011MAR3C5]